MQIYTTETVENVILGDLVVSNAVCAANVIRDLRESIRNLFGGTMTNYERLTDLAVAKALDALKDKASRLGYDGVLGLRIASPSVTEGSVAVIVYGTGFRRKQPQA